MRLIEASPFWSVLRAQYGRSLRSAETSPAATRQNEQFSVRREEAVAHEQNLGFWNIPCAGMTEW